MAREKGIFYILSIKDDGTATLEKVSKEMKQLSRDADKTGKDIEDFGKKGGAGFKAVAIAATAALTSVAYTVKQIRDEFGSFETKLVDMGRVTERAFDDLKRDVMSLPAELGKPMDLMAGYYQVFSAGISNVDKAQRVLIQTAKTSKFAHLEHSEVIKGLTKVMAGYEGQVKTVTEASDLLVAIEKQGQTSVAELIPVIGSLAKMSSDLGISTDEMGASLAVISQTAGSTAEAATQYQSILTGMMKPTTDLTELFEKYGGAQKAIQQLGFEGTLRALMQATGGSAEEMASLFGRVEALKGISTLAIDDFNRMAESVEAIGERAGMSEKAWERYLGTSEATTEFLEGSFSKILIKLGDDIVPELDEQLRSMMGGLSTWVDENEETITGFLRSMVTLMSSMGTVAGKLTAKVGWIPQWFADLGAGLALVQQGKLAWMDFDKVFRSGVEEGAQELRGLIGAFDADPYLFSLKKLRGELERTIEAREALSKFSVGYWLGKKEEDSTKELRAELEKLNHEIGVIEFNKIAKEMGVFDSVAEKTSDTVKALSNDVEDLGEKTNKLVLADKDLVDAFWVDYFEATESSLDNAIRKLDEDYEKHKEVITDKLALEKWYGAELGKIYDKFGPKPAQIPEGIVLPEDDFVWREASIKEGLQEGLNQFVDESPSSFEAFSSLALGAAETIRMGFSDILFDFLFEEIDNLGDYFGNMARNIGMMMTDMLLQMAMVKGLSALGFGGVAKHEGGLILHGGFNPVQRPLRTDERKVIMQTNERVLSRGANKEFEQLMGRLNKASFDGGTISIPINLTSANESMAKDLKKNIERAVLDVIRRHS